MSNMNNSIFITGTKGKLAANIHIPKKQTGKLAILCPGFLDTKDYPHLTILAETLAKEGYTALRFDPTGTWESEGTISEYTTTQYLIDIKSILEHMLSTANYTHILLGGHSRGGEASLLYATKDTRITIVLGIMPSSSTIKKEQRETWKEQGIRISQRDLPESKEGKKTYEVPFGYVLDRDKYNIMNDIPKIKASIILVAGEFDTITPGAHIKNLFEKAHEPKKFIEIPGIGYSYRHSNEEITIVNKKIIEELRIILAKHI
jgi:pimeloyl-ACP methyl ester carboxylesterase